MMSSPGSSVARVVAVCAALCAVVCALGCWGAAGASALEFGGGGEGAGQLEQPHGMAVDQATGDIYVSDFGNNRVDEFEADGTFVRAWGWGVDEAKPEAQLQECTTATGCVKGEGGSGAGELGQPNGVAFDDVSGEPALYVEDSENNRVQKFSPTGAFLRMFGGDVNKLTGGKVCTSAEAAECQRGKEGTGEGEFEGMGRENAIVVGVAGAVYVGDREHVQWFSPEGVREGGFDVDAIGNVSSLALAPSGDLFLTLSRTDEYFTDGSITPEVREYSPAGTLEQSIALEGEKRGGTSEEIGSVFLASDGSGHLFVDEKFRFEYGSEGPWPERILEFNEALQKVEVIPAPNLGTPFQEPGGLALVEVSKAASRIVAAGMSKGLVGVVPVPPPGPTVESEEATPEPAEAAMLKASLNPENHATKYHFEYGTEVGHEAASAEGSLPASFTTEPVSVKVEGLLPATVYDYHVVAEDGEGHVVDGADATFETLPAFVLESVWSSDVSAEGAELDAAVNPLGNATECYFEYAAAGEGEHHSEVVQAGAGAEAVTVRVHVHGLKAHTAYAYRAVVRNTVGGKAYEATLDGELVTQRANAPFALLDGRVWEQVSPPAKESAGITLSRGGGVVQASPDGDAVAYDTNGGSEAGPEGEAQLAQIVSRHGADGWVSRDITTPNAQQSSIRAGQGGEYLWFSEDLGAALVEPEAYTPLSSWTTERTPYLREESKCGGSSPGRECFLPVLTSAGPFADVEVGVKFGGALENAFGDVVVVGGTPSLSRLVLRSQTVSEPLVSGGGGSGGLYEWSPGRLVPVSVLPGAGQQPASGCWTELGGLVGHRVAVDSSRNTVSPDGSLVVWGEEEEREDNGCGHLYMRDVAASETAQLDAVQPGGSGAGAARAEYQDASVGDGLVFFTDSQQLTADSTGAEAGGVSKDLYVYERASGAVVDLTSPVNAGEAAGVQGVIGASEDGSDVYVVARGVLSSAPNARGARAVAGEDNVYLLESTAGGWRAVFVATLSGEDAEDWTMELARQPARVSPDGRWLAFMSERSLTGYDNRDAVSGAADEEVFLYGANGGSLVCVSCDPTGARPTGIFDTETNLVTPLVDQEQSWYERWLAGSLPTGYADEITREFAFRQPRSLADGGRLFFDSSDALVSQAVNRLEDVYEYEPPANGEVAGSDDCTSGSRTYSAALEGCVDLVSSGTSTEESAFMEASANGDDVFFLTAERLAGSDVDSAYDVYDAHACGSGWACAAPAAVSPPCSTTSSCRAAPAPQPAVFGAPASATLVAQENPAPAAAGVTPVKAPVKVKVKVKRKRSKEKARCAGKRRRGRSGCARAKGKAVRVRGGERRGGGR